MPINQNSGGNMSLEPRVTRVEANLESLSRDVINLTSIIREQGKNLENQLNQLSIEVTKAAGPRRTDWNLIISFAFLVLALGSAVFLPLNNASQLNKEEIIATQKAFTEHQQLQLHPVGMALLQRTEEQVQLNKIYFDNAIKTHQEFDNRQFDSLDKKLQTEYTLINNKLETQINALDKRVQLEMRLIADTSNSKINKLEQTSDAQVNADLIELRAWRNKAAGLFDGKPTAK